MSSWDDLGDTGQKYIWTEEYKALFGYPAGLLNASFSGEVAGTSRINVFQNQMYAQEIPSVAPTSLTPYNTSSTATFPVYRYNTAGTVYLPNGIQTSASVQCGNGTTGNPSYIVKYTNVPLSCNDLTQITTVTPNMGVTWWFLGANGQYSNNGAEQVKNNILNNGIPPNYDPLGSFGPIINVAGDNYTYNNIVIGNPIIPWTWNTNSGIIMFSGSAAATGAQGESNVTPQPGDTVTITFWRYEGTLGAGGGDNIWEINGSTITPQGLYGSYTIQGSTFKATSDYRIKEDVQNLDINLYNVDKLRPVIYKQIDNNSINIGLIAHELQEYFPFLVTGEKDGTKTQSVNYMGLIGVLIKEIQDLKKKVAILENKIE